MITMLFGIATSVSDIIIIIIIVVVIVRVGKIMISLKM